MPQPTTDLDTIKTKVRRLTRSPSLSQLSEADLEQYINTFIVYDFPEHLRTFNLRTPFTFVCNPYQCDYPIDEESFGGNTTNQLFDFQNKYVTIYPPVYIGGFQVLYSQSREQFFQIYPKINSKQTIGTLGDGVTTQFTGVVNSSQGNLPSPAQNQQLCLLPGQVLFSSIDSLNEGISLIDVPLVDASTGFQFPKGNLYVPGTEPTVGESVLNPSNNINYLTGEYTITFGGDTPVAPGAGQQIYSQTVPQQPSIPMAMLFYGNKITLRPMPDQPYRVEMEVFQNPIALLSGNSSPQLKEWWQYISYGTARKIFQDRMDVDSVALIEPEYKKQEMLCMRRTLVEYANERTATIYSDQTMVNGAGGWGRGGGQF